MIPQLLILMTLLGSCGTYGPYRDPVTDTAAYQLSNRSLGQTNTGSETFSGNFSGVRAPASVSFLVLSDIHGYDKESLVRSQSTWDRHLFFWGKPQDTGFMNTRAVLEAAGQGNPPDFIVLPGDLTVDGELASHRMLQGVLDNFSAANPAIPVYVTTGNHDVNSPQARRHGRLFTLPTLSVSPGGFASIYSNYGYSQALSRDRESLSYVVEPVPGLALLMLDTASWHKNLFFPIRVSNTKGIIRESTLDWMEMVLAEARRQDMMIVVVQHHPLAIGIPVSIPDPYKPDPMNSERTVGLYEQYGVALVLAGHRHRFDQYKYKDLNLVLAAAVSTSSNNALLLELEGKRLRTISDPYGLEP